MVWIHRKAFKRILKDEGQFHSIAIVGGGLFPRSLQALKSLYPCASFTIIDRNRKNLYRVKVKHMESANYICNDFENIDPAKFDLIILPLAYFGLKRKFYRQALFSNVVLHDWIWNMKGRKGVIVSVFLLKRMNLV